MKDICIRIKELRKLLNMSQVNFAKNLGVTNAHISKIEKGGTAPSDALTKLICREYEVNELWIKKGIEPIFLDDLIEIVEKTESNMIESTAIFNKLLSSNSDSIRHVASELRMLFADITEVDELSEVKKMEYLELVKNMLIVMKKYNTPIKEAICSNQITMAQVIENHFDNYKKEMNDSIEGYIKYTNEYK